jgi:hypothetical protein
MTAVDIQFRYASEEDFVLAMQDLGLAVRPEARDEEKFEHCATPPTMTDQGIVRTVRFLDPAQLAKVPDILAPTCLIDWRSDEGAEPLDTYTCDGESTTCGCIRFSR